MSHFYIIAQGQILPVTCTGSAESGIRAHIQGRTTGVRVELFNSGGKDYILVWSTGGSNNPARIALVADWEVYTPRGVKY